MLDKNDLRVQTLRWFLDNGVNEILDIKPSNACSFAGKKVLVKNISKELSSEKNYNSNYINTPSITEAIKLSSLCKNVDELRRTLESFSGCSLSKTAKNMVFSDGKVNSNLMILGDFPGQEEDKSGIPFSGREGDLLNNMLKAIKRDRNNTYLSNMVFWRPPGNRKPNNEEINICLPFVKRHIALIKPKILVLMGAITAQTMMNSREGITQIRGKWREIKIDNISFKSIAIYHPLFLLKQGARKREAWIDLQEIDSALNRERTK